MAKPGGAKEPKVSSGDLPLEERVQRRAREISAYQGHQSGSGVEDWQQAEDEIRHIEEQKHKG